MDCEAAFRATDIGAALSDRLVDRFMAKAAFCVFGAGETSNALEHGGQVVLILAGAARISQIEDGRVSFQDVAAGHWSGLAQALAGRALPPRSLLALDATECLIWAGDDLLSLLKSNAAASFAVATHIAVSTLSGIESADPLIRVYRDILRAAKPSGSSTWTVDPMPRHRELAQRSGVAEEDAAAAVAHLVRAGIARRRYPALDIDDREQLKRLAGS